MADSKGISFTKEVLEHLSLKFSDREIGEQFGVTASNIKYWRHKLGIPTTYVRHRLPTEKEEWVRLTNECSDPALAKQFGVHTNAILFWRKKFAIPAKHRLDRHKTYSINENFFSQIETEEQAYSLGFICGDGNIHPRRSGFSISLHEKDADILFKIRDAMSSNAPIRATFNKSGYKPTSRFSTFTIHRKNMVEDLARLGVGPAKSLNIRYPQIKPDLDRHFIRGLCDADGWVTNQNFGICGASLLVSDALDRIKAHISNDIKIAEYENHIRFFGVKRHRPVIQWIYRGAAIFLERKFLAYCKYWS